MKIVDSNCREMVGHVPFTDFMKHQKSLDKKGKCLWTIYLAHGMERVDLPIYPRASVYFSLKIFPSVSMIPVMGVWKFASHFGFNWFTENFLLKSALKCRS